jgi:hypothetical protein
MSAGKNIFLYLREDFELPPTYIDVYFLILSRFCCVKYFGQTFNSTDICHCEGRSNLFFSISVYGLLHKFAMTLFEKSSCKTTFLLEYFFTIFADQASLHIIFCALGNKYLYKYLVNFL